MDQIENGKVVKICGAKLKPHCPECGWRTWDDTCPKCNVQTEERGLCTVAPMIGRERCYHHGGASLSGPSHPNFDTGKWSKHLPTRMKDAYENSRSDPDLLSHIEDISLTDSRVEDVLKRVDSGESGALVKQLKIAFKEFKRARAKRDAEKMAEYLELVDELITKSHSDYLAWEEVGKLLERRRKLVESERKRRLEAGLTLSLEASLALIGTVEKLIMENVTDVAVKEKIARELTRLVG